MPRQALATMLFLALLTAPAVAQPAPDDGPPPAPENRPPETPAERQRNNAAKLAGLLGFVNQSCPDIQSDKERFKSVVSGLGVPYDDLEHGDLQLRARAYMEIYAKDTPASCARAVANFGEKGTTIPGLIIKR